MLFGWRVVKHVKSTLCVCRRRPDAGVGAADEPRGREPDRGVEGGEAKLPFQAAWSAATLSSRSGRLIAAAEAGATAAISRAVRSATPT